MRTLVRQSLAYVVSVALLAAPLWGVPATPLGVVTVAERAQIGSVPAATGATVFDGDTLSTDSVGILRVRAGAAQFQLFPSSTAAVTQTSTGVRATLCQGTVAFSAANAGAIEIQASEARIRPQGNVQTQGQVTLANPKELLVTAKGGALEITIGDETQIVPEATSYRVLIDSLDPPEPCRAGTKLPRKPTKNAGRNRFYVVPLIVVGMATAVAVHEAWESPEKP